ncbi:unnamed protein product [Gongylonema pulchrum]|uniref:Galectin n=1 Tax=Gongylonema pulchrum TaxID=637853 RepID=A0A183DUQ6_9BILA|nr:unnamed protein product [Gongylonema pulchrum]
MSEALPYVESIPGGLYPGRAIVLKGAVVHEPHQKRFAVELCCGLLVQGDHQDDKALHFNPRFDVNNSWFGGQADRQIVLNSMTGNRWGIEERYANVFKEGYPFSMRILALAEYYKKAHIFSSAALFFNLRSPFVLNVKAQFQIAVDGRHLCDYLHRIPVSEVKTLYIRGNVRIDTIEYQGDEGSPVVG